MEQGLVCCFLNNLRKQNNNNNKTLQSLHSSACRGAFFNSCKMEGKGCENNHPSTYYRFTKYKMYEKNPKLFPTILMFCKAFFPRFEPKHRIFEC